MEFLAILISVFSVLLIFLSISRKSKRTSALPPSISLLDRLYLLITSDLPHQAFLRLSKKYGDFMFVRLGRINMLVVSSSSAAKEVFKSHDLVFASRPSSPFSDCVAYNRQDVAFAPYGDHWRYVRKLCTVELFTAKQVDIFHSIRKVEMSAFFSELRALSTASQALDLSEGLGNLTFNIMARTVLSKSFSGAAANENEKKDALYFKELSMADVKDIIKRNVGEFFPFLSWMERATMKRLQAHFKEKDAFLDKEVEEHRTKLANGEVTTQERKDLVYVMLSEGQLNNTIIKAVAFDVIVAGTDTSAATMEWIMSELIRNPRVLRKLQEELHQVTGRKRDLDEKDVPKLRYLQAVVKESLRMYPSIPLLLPHESTEPCTIRGYFLPAKTRLIVNAYALGRDPAVWNDPHSFVPERFLDSSVDIQGQNCEAIPFGTGRRKCPGMHLALTTMNYVIGSLVNSFDWELPPGQGVESLDMSQGRGLSMPRAVPLKLTPRTMY